MLDFRSPSFEGEEEEEEEEEVPYPYHVGGSSSSFIETYPHFLAWQYDVMNPDGSSIPLTMLEHVPNAFKSLVLTFLSKAFLRLLW